MKEGQKAVNRFLVVLNKEKVSKVSMAKKLEIGRKTFYQFFESANPTINNFQKYITALNSLTGKEYCLCDFVGRNKINNGKTDNT